MVMKWVTEISNYITLPGIRIYDTQYIATWFVAPYFQRENIYNLCYAVTVYYSNMLCSLWCCSCLFLVVRCASGIEGLKEQGVTNYITLTFIMKYDVLFLEPDETSPYSSNFVLVRFSCTALLA